MTYLRDDGITPQVFFNDDYDVDKIRGYFYFKDGSLKKFCIYEEGVKKAFEY